MFSLTNVGLSMCVKEYSDVFLNLMIAYIESQFWHSCPFQRIIPLGGGNFWHITYHVWREKDVMTHMLLVYPA
jgi:hypothetical protein